MPVENDESRWLREPAGGEAQEQDEAQPASPVPDESLIDTGVARAHRRLLREPQHFMGWLPVYDMDDNELLVWIDPNE